MKRLVSHVVRILLAVFAVLSVLVIGFGWVIRQPSFGSLSFPGGLHADASALERHVRFLSSTDPPRNWQRPEGLERAARYISESLAATSARCSEQHYQARTVDMKNLRARFGPDHGPLVVVGAHYDVFGQLPGADDNASGVAGVLELARLLDHQHLSRPVEIVAYSTEEPPFFGGSEMGSAVHAASLLESGRPVRAMIAVEMIGYFTRSQPTQSWLLSLVYPHRGDFAAVAGRWSDRALVREAKKAFRGASRLPVVSYTGPVALGADLSDHRSYWEAGFPAVMVTDTAYLRNPNYHMDTDTADTLDYHAMAHVVDGLLSTVVHLAND